MSETARTFNQAYVQRIHELRKARGWTQEQMATALDLPLDRYKKYEIRTPLPPYLIERFALHVGRDMAYVLTGKSEPSRRGPRTESQAVPARPKRGQQSSAFAPKIPRNQQNND